MAKKTTQKKQTKKATVSRASAPAGQSRIKGTIKRALSKKEVAREIEFSFHAPDASSVTVAGTFNGWDALQTSLQKDPQGNWKKTVPLKPGTYQYRFLIDGNWENDQKECELMPNEHGSYNCVLRIS